jgi:CRP-like cAMP-binding protein
MARIVHFAPKTMLPATAGIESDARNQILRSLGREDASLLRSSGRMVELAPKVVITEANNPIHHIYFPETAVISLVTVVSEGAIEAMTVGNDGFYGVPVFHGLSSTFTRAICQIPGSALRIEVDTFRALLAESPSLSRTLARYSQLLIETLSQSAACNRLHVIEQRCARWLLMSHDRVGHDDFALTQVFLAQMLGVRRPGVTVAIGILERAGLISHTRGHIRIEDREGLEKAACECYHTIRTRQRALLG